MPLLHNILSLTLVFNTGAAFGILPGEKVVLTVLPVITVIAVFALYARSSAKNELFYPLALLIGGALGNFIDRVFRGCVVDFFDLYWKSYHWPAFNFADAAICIGIFLLIIHFFKTSKTKN